MHWLRARPPVAGVGRCEWLLPWVCAAHPAVGVRGWVWGCAGAPRPGVWCSEL